MNTKAAVLYEVKKPVVVEDVELMEPGPGEVRVKWAANGVCHSDLHVITGDYPHPLPVVLGHEASGVVEKLGAGVTTVSVGDHVCSSYIPSCGRCGYCIGGQPTMCALRDLTDNLALRTEMELAKLEQILASDVPAFNAACRDAGLGAIVPKPGG